MDLGEKKNVHRIRCSIVYIETICHAQLILLLYIHRNFIHYVKEVAQFCCVKRIAIVILHFYVCSSLFDDYSAISTSVLLSFNFQ